MPKVIELMREETAAGRPFVSFEFFPPKTDIGVENLMLRIDRMVSMDPVFVDVTWVAGGRSGDLTRSITSNAKRYCGTEAMMHLCLTGMTVPELKRALQDAKADGITSILALRGDPAKGADKWAPTEGGLKHAAELVQLIREEHGDYFCVGVAAHPEGHPDAASYDADVAHLAAKVAKGADFVLTQFFYDTKLYFKFVKDARAAGVPESVPIVPGVMPIQNFVTFDKMTRFFGTRVPPDVTAALVPIRDDDEAVKAYGIRLGMEMCQQLLDGGAPGLHFYTLNLETVVRGIVTGCGLADHAKRRLPWRPSAEERRMKEAVRPIFWANRPRSYVSRTATWDEYPNGRWGDARSPAFGDLTESHFYATVVGTPEERKTMWGDAPLTKEDVHGVFTSYVQGKVSRLPWCPSALALETSTILEEVVRLNRNGYLTINSQPRVNGVKSSDPTFGWGGPGGYVYQKAYVECFCAPSNLRYLMEAAKTSPNITFHAVDVRGNTYHNFGGGVGYGPQAVTWGVFPCREVLQPTVVDPDSFLVWKDEAFALWLQQWASIYDEDSASCDLIHDVHDSYFLVNVVDHDFVRGDIYEVFRRAIDAKHGGGGAAAAAALRPAKAMAPQAAGPVSALVATPSSAGPASGRAKSAVSAGAGAGGGAASRSAAAPALPRAANSKAGAAATAGGAATTPGS